VDGWSIIIGFCNQIGEEIARYPLAILVRGHSVFTVAIKKFKYVGFPCRDIFVQHVVTVVRGQTYLGVDFQRVWLAQAFQFFRQSTSGGCAEVVLSMDQHYCGACLANRGEQAVAHFGRALPRTSPCTEGDHRTDQKLGAALERATPVFPAS